MEPTPQERLEELATQAEQNIGQVEQLPQQERNIVHAAIARQDVYQIAQDHNVTEGYVWQVLGNIARMDSGAPLQQVETAGFGSDTDPGVTGGYGDTGFGSLGTEPPEPVPEEPAEEDKSKSDRSN